MRTSATLCGLLGSLLILACESSSGPSVKGPAFFRASINGQRWVSDSLRVVAVLHPANHIVVQGNQEVLGGGPPFLLTVGTQITGVGTFPIPAALDGGTDGAGYVGPVGPSGSLNAYATDSVHTGALSITHLDTAAHVVTGTFYFSAVSADHFRIRVTKGEFRATYFEAP